MDNKSPRQPNAADDMKTTAGTGGSVFLMGRPPYSNGTASGGRRSSPASKYCDQREYQVHGRPDPSLGTHLERAASLGYEMVKPRVGSSIESRNCWSGRSPVDVLLNPVRLRFIDSVESRQRRLVVLFTLVDRYCWLLGHLPTAIGSTRFPRRPH
jgi:hypothetical protein